MLAKFGNETIYINSTHGKNIYEFYLTSLVVLDEYGSGIPIAFCISNEKYTITWTIFFRKLKELDSVSNLNSTVFISDDDNAFYNSRKEVFGPVLVRLLCSWHADRSWRNKLLELISSTEKRALVYKSLRILLQATKFADFEAELEDFLVSIFADDETK